MLTALDTTYKVKFSESYTGTSPVHHEITIMKGYEFCASLQRAFESLTFENYTNFVQRVRCTAVDVCYINNVKFKVFDSQTRYLYGNRYMSASS